MEATCRPDRLLSGVACDPAGWLLTVVAACSPEWAEQGGLLTAQMQWL